MPAAVEAPLLVTQPDQILTPPPPQSRPSPTTVSAAAVTALLPPLCSGRAERLDCNTLLQSPARHSSTSVCPDIRYKISPYSTAIPPTAATVTQQPLIQGCIVGMNPPANPLLTQGHPLDDIPVSVSPPRQPVHPIPETAAGDITGSGSDITGNSSEFGPYVSGLPVPDDFRQRSSSFNNSMLTRPHHRATQQTHTGHNLDPLRRFSESQNMTRTGSAENVIGHHTNINRLRHSQTISEIPPHALSNDSGYITPPNRQHTSPPWPPNTTSPPQWPSSNTLTNTYTAASHTAVHTAAQRNSAPLPLSQHLTVETAGHYQPEPLSPPQLLVAQPHYQSLQPTIGNSALYNSPGGGYMRHGRGDPYSSLHSQSSSSTVPNTPQTPEEGKSNIF